MSLHPQAVGPVPDETARVARAVFPRGNPYLQLRDELGSVYADEDFADLFPRRGQSAEAPWRLALVTVLQFAEGLSDRQAAEAVRSRIDWKSLLALELTDTGFHYSVLSEFRTRLIAGSAAHRLRDGLLGEGQARGWLKRGGRQRTDATRVLGALRQLDRLECVAETLRQALNTLATAAPAGLRAQVTPEWFDRYGRRVEDARVPTSPAARQRYAEVIGADGRHLLTALTAAAPPEGSASSPRSSSCGGCGSTRTRGWTATSAGAIRRPPRPPPPAQRLDTPYEPEARYGTKRSTSWVGYKVHLTETCGEDGPHLVTHVETTTATTADGSRVTPIPAALARRDLLPRQHRVDAASVSADELVTSRTTYGVDPLGPMQGDGKWQAKAGQGYDVSHFTVDWSAQTVTCPQGRTSRRWVPTRTRRQQETITGGFAGTDGTPGPARARCTRSKTAPRSLTRRREPLPRAIQAARQRQTTPACKTQYAARAGIEGTLSQGVRAFELRQARYRGLAKTHVPHVATAGAMNLARISAWLQEVPRARTRQSRFAALANLA